MYDNNYSLLPMKILISAAACNPYRGSEAGVGWTAVCRIACDHEVYVLVDSNNKEGWEKGRQEGLIPENVQVRFLRKKTRYVENRLIARIQSWLWYAAFNRLVLSAAQQWHKEEQFDLCHQVTIAAWRMPSLLWKLPIPFIWGPIGGTAYIPKNFRAILSLPARIFETARDIQTWIATRSTAFRESMTNTAVIFAANEETEHFLRKFRGNKPLIRLPIVSVSSEKIELFKRAKTVTNPSGPLILFAGGNIEGRKGVSLALKALAKVKKQGIKFHYTVAGGGPDIANLKKLAANLDLSEEVEFHPGYSGKAYIEALQASDIYFLPSFRESTPVTLIEAYLAGCYPVVADTSAQGEIVRLAGGHAVPTETVGDLVDGLAEAMNWCSRHREQLSELADESRERVVKYFNSDSYEITLKDAYVSSISNFD